MTMPNHANGGHAAPRISPLGTGHAHRKRHAVGVASLCLLTAVSSQAVDAKLPIEARSPQRVSPRITLPDSGPVTRSLGGYEPAAVSRPAVTSLASSLMREALKSRARRAKTPTEMPTLRVMLPVACKALNTSLPMGAGSFLTSFKSSPTTRLASLPLLPADSVFVPRSDTTLSALPMVWRNGLAAMPATRLAANPAPAASAEALPIPAMGPGSQVINVAALKLPATSKPLPPALQSKAVSADTRYISSMPRLAQAGSASADPKGPAASASNQIDVTVSTFVVLVAPNDLQTVAIADPNIADVVVINSRAVLVNGKAPGSTSLVIVDNKIRQYHVRVLPITGESPADLTVTVATAINLPNVQVRALRGAVILEGTVANADEKKRANDIAGLYSSKVVDLMHVRTPETPVASEPLATQIKTALGNNAIQVRLLGNTVLLEGLVPTASQKETAEAIASALAKEMKVVNLIRIPEPTALPVVLPVRLTLDEVNDTLRMPAVAPVPEAPGVVAATPSPVTSIRARQVKDQIILEGTAANQKAIDQAAEVAARTGLVVINRIELAQAAPGLSAEIQQTNGIALAINRAIPKATVMVNGGAERLILTGVVPDTNAAVLAEQIARGYAKQVDNLLMTPRPQQIDVDISVLEITKTALKGLGVTFNNFLDSNPTGFVIGQATSAALGPDAIQTLSPLSVAIRAEVNKGNARILSSPRTTVLSGRTATFKVGGEVPIPTGSTTNAAGTTTTIEFKPFGILLDIVPVCSEEGAITMQVRSEVSQPDFINLSIILPGGTVIPGFSQRQAQTEVTVEPGGSIVMGGLISETTQTMDRGVPFLSKIPVLGALFSSKRFQKSETELIFTVTPRLLPSKLKPGQLAPASPFSKGDTSSLKVPMGNPGIPTFTTGGSFAVGAAGGGK